MTLLGGILLPIVIARLLGEEALGIFSSASILGLLITTLIDWGYETRIPVLVASLRQSPHASIQATSSISVPAHSLRTILSDVQQIKLFLWLIALILCGLWGIRFHSIRGGFSYTVLDTLWWACCIFVVWALLRAQMATYTAILRGLEDFSTIARVENLISLGMYMLSLLCLFFTNELLPALVLFPIAECLKITVFHFYVKKEYLQEKPDNSYITTRQEIQGVQGKYRAILAELQRQVPFVVLQGLSILESRAGMFALAALALSQREVGYFGAAMRFIIALRTFAGAMFNVVLPAFDAKDGNTAHNTAFLQRVLVLGGGVGFIGSLFLFLAAEPLILLIYGTAFQPAILLLRIVAPLFFLQTLLNIFEAFLLTQEQQHTVNRTLVLTLTVFALGVLALTTLQGSLSAENTAWATLALSGLLCVRYGFKSAQILKRGA